MMSNKPLFLVLLTAFATAGAGGQTSSTPEKRVAVSVDAREAPKTLEVAPISIELYEFERR
jgi:hypothetical protein